MKIRVSKPDIPLVPKAGLDGRDGRDGLDGVDGKNGIDGRDGVDGKDGRDGKDIDPSEVTRFILEQVSKIPRPKDGQDGKMGLRGKAGPSGDDGNDGWSPILGVVEDGERSILEVVDWTGGEGQKPQAGWFLGSNGPTQNKAEASNIRGKPGQDGIGGGTLKEIYLGPLQRNPRHLALVFNPLVIEGQTVYEMSINIP